MCPKPNTSTLMDIKKCKGNSCDNLIHLITLHEVTDDASPSGGIVHVYP